LVVAEVGDTPANDQIYRITFDGSVSDEPGYVAFGGQADQVAAALKERFSDGMSLAEALKAALEALTPPPPSGSGSAATAAAAANGELTAATLEVAILDRARDHRTFRRLRGARLEELIAEIRGGGAEAATQGAGEPGSAGEAGAAESADTTPGDTRPS